jgi:amidase
MPAGTDHRLQPRCYKYTFAAHEPEIRVASGDSVTAETLDAFGYDRDRRPLPEGLKQRIAGTTLQESNPLVGPVFVEGAEEGDLLAVHILAISPTRGFALSKQGPGFGSLTGEAPGKALLYNDPIPLVWYEWQLDLERGVASFDMPGSMLGRADVPLRPFIGSIGVAPRFGRVETALVPGEYGGNMDFRDIVAGTTLYLPVWVKGAYLCFGDVHAAQGDGEINGTALEVTAEVRLRLEVVKGRTAQWPRLVDAEHLATIGSGRPLEDCIRISQIEMLGWLTGEYGFQRDEAWQLMGQAGGIRIANFVDPAYTAAALFPRRYLRGS